MLSWKMPSMRVGLIGRQPQLGLGGLHLPPLHGLGGGGGRDQQREARRPATGGKRDGIIGNLKVNRFFVEEYDGADGCVSPLGRSSQNCHSRAFAVPTNMLSNKG